MRIYKYIYIYVYISFSFSLTNKVDHGLDIWKTMGLLSNQNNRRETKTAKSKDLRGKHFVVTGANTGLGYVTTRELAKMGAKVTMACRSAERGQKAADRIRQEAFAKPVKEVRPRGRRSKM